MDLVTQNHASMPGNTPTWPFLSKQTVSKVKGVCKGDIKKERTACKGCATEKEKCKSKDCREARRCMLVPYKAGKGQGGCCPGQTPHHLVEVHSFTKAGERASGKRLAAFDGSNGKMAYDDHKAPCVCCDQSSRYKGDHGKMHAIQGMWERAHMRPGPPRDQMGGNGSWTYKQAKQGGVAAMKKTFPSSGCADKCIEAQLDNYHRQMGCANDTPLRADRSPLKTGQQKSGTQTLADLGLKAAKPATTI
jgi:hypothetical protein